MLKNQRANDEEHQGAEGKAGSLTLLEERAGFGDDVF
jgi:hypothetical protein